MYIDASDSCNSLTFQIGEQTFTRQWNVKVTQYAMDFPNKAPKGCLQYHFAGDGNDDGDLDPTVIRRFVDFKVFLNYFSFKMQSV